MDILTGLNIESVAFEQGEKVYSQDLSDDDPRKAVLDDMAELLGVPVSFVDSMPEPEKVIDVMELAKAEAWKILHRYSEPEQENEIDS